MLSNCVPYYLWLILLVLNFAQSLAIIALCMKIGGRDATTS